MTRLTLVVLAGITTLAHADSVVEKKARADIDATALQAAADLKSCGKQFTVVFDWKAYDALDWAKLGKDKVDWMGNEKNSLAELGIGLDKLCADKDYREALSKITTITYRSTNNDRIWIKASIAGSRMTLENYSFGSTRKARDYESAAKAAL